jgi:3-dehydroquinate synthase
VDRWLELMQVDKKTEGGKLRFVLLPEIGQARFEAAEPDALRHVLEKTTIVQV